MLKPRHLSLLILLLSFSLWAEAKTYSISLQNRNGSRIPTILMGDDGKYRWQMDNETDESGEPLGYIRTVPPTLGYIRKPAHEDGSGDEDEDYEDYEYSEEYPQTTPSTTTTTTQKPRRSRRSAVSEKFRDGLNQLKSTLMSFFRW